MQEIQAIKNLAKEIVKNWNLTVDTWEAYMESAEYAELVDEIGKIKGVLMNYEEFKQDYLDGLIDEIDAIIYKKEK